jgi:catechol-2,3-dioxygenase
VCHGALRTPDLEASVWHAIEVLGLREVDRDRDVVYLTCGRKHHDLELIAGERAALDHIGLEASDTAALHEIRQRVEQSGLEIVSAPGEPGIGEALRFLAPGGHVFEVHAGMDRDQPTHYDTSGVRPRKLGHITVTTPDRAELEACLEDVLGFIPSDRVGEEAVWMRCNPDHHGIAILGPADAGLRHFAWEVESWAWLERVADHVLANGLSLTWGPGRHGPGNNVACYHRDPVGATHEYLAEIEQVHDERWRGRDWADVPNWRSLWGPGNDPVVLDGDFPRVAEPARTPAK